MLSDYILYAHFCITIDICALTGNVLQGQMRVKDICYKNTVVLFYYDY